jgi:hypothetical protein
VNGNDEEEPKRWGVIQALQNKGLQNETDEVEKGSRIRYNQAAVGKEWQSKQGSTATCSGLTK